jgi:hypothetical protein
MESLLGRNAVARLTRGIPPEQRVACADPPDVCDTFNLDPEGSRAFKDVTLPPSGGSGTPKESNGLPLPDPNCSPGAINPTITIEILKAKGFTTKCVRGRTPQPPSFLCLS